MPPTVITKIASFFLRMPRVDATNGLMEFAGVDKMARSKMGVWKMQEWTYRHDVAGVDNAGVD